MQSAQGFTDKRLTRQSITDAVSRLRPLLKRLRSLKKPDIVGIDPGSRCTKIVKVTRGGGKLGVDFCGLCEVPRDAPDFADQLRNFIAQNSLAGLSAAVCLDDSGIRFRNMELPVMPEADLKEAVRWNMREVVEGKIGDYAVAYSLGGETATEGKKRQALLGYAVQKSLLADLAGLVSKIGFKPAVIEPSVVSLAAAIERTAPNDCQWMAGVDIGSAKIQMTFLDRDRFHFSRGLPGLKAGDAETDKAEFMKRLAGEIQNSIDTFSVTFHQENIQRIYLSGGGAGTEGLSEYLSKNLAVPTEILNPFSGMELSPQAGAIVAERPYLFSQALSLAWMEK